MKVLQYPPGSARIAPLIFLLLLATAGSGSLGCGEAQAGPDLPPAQRLRRSFPDQAGAVLAPDEGFVSTAEGFALRATTTSGSSRGVEVTLPRDGGGLTRLRDRGGFEVQVRELDALGEGAVAERSVAYPRAGGTSFWTAAPGGVEEWLHLEAGAVRKGEPVAEWEIEGATVRQRGQGAELVDARGVVRLCVTAPAAYGAGGRQIRAWMTGQATRLSLWVEADGEAVLVDPLWTPAGSLTTERFAATVTPLPSGQALIVGGQNNGGALANVDLYDPKANTWTPAAPLAAARYHHTATLLPSGQVLVIGGEISGSHLTSVELFDPATSTWKAVAPLTAARAEHTATLLSGGQVLVVGGQNNKLESLASGEIYDPAADTWMPFASLTTARHGHITTVLPSGQVMVVGGQDSKLVPLASAEIYNLIAAAWLPAASLTTARYAHTATTLPSGQVLIVGGIGSGGLLASAELYDPAADTWTPTPSLTAVRYRHTTTLLQSGQTLVAGGYDSSFDPLASAELYDPKANTWTVTASLTAARAEHAAALLQSGKVLVVGGFGSGAYLASAELYSPLAQQGNACTSAVDCESGFCADGVCCDTACTDTCVACSAAKKGGGADGSCGPLPAYACGIENSASASSSSSGSSGSSSGTGAGGGASTGGNEGPNANAGCGCRITEGPAAGTPWLGLGLLLMLRRRPRDATRAARR